MMTLHFPSNFSYIYDRKTPQHVSALPMPLAGFFRKP